MHIGLKVPSRGSFGLRVGGARQEANAWRTPANGEPLEVRVWSEGSVFCFDPTRVHEAWNFASELRAVLLLDLGAERLPWTKWPTWLQREFPELSPRVAAL